MTRRLDQLTGEPPVLSAEVGPVSDDVWRPILPVPKGAPAGPPRHRAGAPSVVWRYHDAAGRLLGLVCRWDTRDRGKTLRPATFCEGPDGVREWRWRGFTVPRPLYGLHELSTRPDAPVLVVEGEKAADAAAVLFPDFVVVTSPGGAKAAKKADWSSIKGRELTIWPDADGPGAQYADDVERESRKHGVRSVRRVQIPAEFPSGWDLADLPPEGWTQSKLRSLVSSASTRSQAALQSDPDRAATSSQRDKLIDVGELIADYWHDPDFEPFATVRVNGRSENYSLASKAFQLVLHRAFSRAYPRTRPDGSLAPAGISDSAMKEALNALTALAREGPEFEPTVRFGVSGGKVYVDLGDPSWSAVEIDGDGYRIVETPPVKFVRPAGFRPLPKPAAQGSLADLRPFVNVADDRDFAVLMAFLVAAVRSRGSHWVLVVSGEQGSAKTALSRVVRRLVDPNAAELRTMPKKEEDVILAACNSRMVAFDNVSKLSADAADLICQLCTGIGHGRRRLYAETEWIASACRPVLLNGIPDLLTRGDLADRALSLSLPKMPDTERRTESEFWQAFDEAEPALLAGLFSAVSMAIRREHEVQLPYLLRMADALRFACAAAPALGLTDEKMFAAIESNARSGVGAILEASPLVTPLVNLLDASGGHWSGTATELLARLGESVDDRVKRLPSWPADGTRMSGQLRRLTPALRILGVCVLAGEKRTARARAIDISRTGTMSDDGPAMSASIDGEGEVVVS